MGETLTPRPAAIQITSLADLRPGDLMFTRIGGLVPGVFPVGVGMLMLGERVRIGRLKFDHVGIVVEAAKPGWTSTDPDDRTIGPPPTRWAPHLVQAMPEGAEEIALTAERHWNADTVYARLVEDWPGQMLDAAAIARLMVATGVEYSFGSYLALALWRWGVKTPRLEAWINRRTGPAITLKTWSNGPELGSGFARGGRLPAEAICSVLADQALTLAGKRVMRGVRPQVVTPGALAQQLMMRPGVLWGGAGLNG